ncbi:MAG: pentapeptide repeat-containing protein [Chloroflexota bacterium]
MQRLKSLYNRIKSSEQLLEQVRDGDNLDALSALGVLKEREALTDGSFEGLDLNSANLAQATFAAGKMRDIVLQGATLTHTYFHTTQVQGADFSQANLTYANFREAYAQEANFSEAICTHANFSRADLTRTNFTHADLQNANFWSTTLVSANLAGATLTGATLIDVVCDASTILPDGSAWHADVDWSVFTE